MEELDVLRTFKQMWGPKQYTRGAFARDARGERVSPGDATAVRFCTLGMIECIAPDSIHDDNEGGYLVGVGAAAARRLAEKLAVIDPEGYEYTMSIGVEPMIASISDKKDGYERIMKAVDAILIEEAPAAMQGFRVDEREMVPA